MKTIWKFETPFENTFTLEMPMGAKIISVQQDQKTMIPCMWAIVNTDNKIEKRTFELFGTGIFMNEDVNRKYIGTYQYQRGEFVGHIFERL